MNIEQFSQGSSFLHKADARVKIIGLIAIAAVVVSSTNWLAPTMTLFAGIIGAVSVRLSLKALCLRLLIVNGFTLFLWFTLPFTYPGAEVIELGPLAVSVQGLKMAALITAKTNAVVLACICLLSTSSMTDIGYGLDRLGFSKKLCLILLFSYRYIFVIQQEFNRLRRAARVRCFSSRTNMHTYRTFGYLFGMTLVKSWQRAERVNQAMVLRGFNGIFYTLNETHISMWDMVLGAILLSFAAVIFSINILL